MLISSRDLQRAFGPWMHMEQPQHSPAAVEDRSRPGPAPERMLESNSVLGVVPSCLFQNNPRLWCLWGLGARVCSAAASPDLQAGRITAPLRLSQLMLSLVPPMPADKCHVVKTPSGGSRLPNPA